MNPSKPDGSGPGAPGRVPMRRDPVWMIPLLGLVVVLLILSGSPREGESRDVDADSIPVIELEEELRRGVLQGREAEEFGRIGALTVTTGRELWLLETLPPMLRRFDRDGSALGTSGRAGEGPGEFSGVRGIEPHPDGGVWVLDAALGRLSAFDAEGAFMDSHPLPEGLGSGFRADPESGQVLLHVRDTGALEQGAGQGGPPPEGWIRLDQDMQVLETIPTPRDDRVLGGEMVIQTRQGPVQPNLSVTLHTADLQGRIIGAHNRSYTLVAEDGGQIDTLVQREAEPVRKSDGERQELEEVIAQSPGSGGASSLDAEKPILASLEVDRDNRIWVQLRTDAVELDVTSGLRWREPPLWHVWEPDGSPVGEIELPMGARWMAALGDQLWVLEEGPMGEDQLVQYRMSIR